jgi:hypothetical protein
MARESLITFLNMFYGKIIYGFKLKVLERLDIQDT